MLLKWRVKESINVSTAAMGIFNFLMILQKKWISKLFLILCSIKTGQITLFRAESISSLEERLFSLTKK